MFYLQRKIQQLEININYNTFR